MVGDGNQIFLGSRRLAARRLSCSPAPVQSSIHTDALGSVGPSVCGSTKDQRALAACVVHVPRATIVRAAQRGIIGIIGQRQGILSTTLYIQATHTHTHTANTHRHTL